MDGALRTRLYVRSAFPSDLLEVVQIHDDARLG